MRSQAGAEANCPASAVALEGAHGLVGQVELIAAASQETEGALALAIRGRRRLKTPPEDRYRGCELVVPRLAREPRGDEPGLDAQGGQPALYAIRAPAVQPTAILRESLDEACIVEVAHALELCERRVDPAGLYPLALEMAPDLGHRAVTMAEVTEALVESFLKLSLRVRRALSHQQRHAAWLIGGTSASRFTVAGSTGSIGWTRSRSMSSAA
ncbi:MAG: hypothetical protein QOH46_706 [Solirubrobacteraceae bacterium]|nr:hypothetical protein [Solirubrobacteraceae bacterium]